MPILIKEIQGEVIYDYQGTIKIMGILSELDLEDYIEVQGLKAILQNFLFAKSVTELFIDGLDAYRIPDDGNHPVLSLNGYNAKSKYTELTISYA
jgi:hypothetical protein